MKFRIESGKLAGLKGPQKTRAYRKIYNATRVRGSAMFDLKREIEHFEQQYRMTSAEFCKRLTEGAIEESQETFRWKALLSIRDEARVR